MILNRLKHKNMKGKIIFSLPSILLFLNPAISTPWHVDYHEYPYPNAYIEPTTGVNFYYASAADYNKNCISAAYQCIKMGMYLATFNKYEYLNATINFFQWAIRRDAEMYQRNNKSLYKEGIIVGIFKGIASKNEYLTFTGSRVPGLQPNSGQPSTDTNKYPNVWMGGKPKEEPPGLEVYCVKLVLPEPSGRWMLRPHSPDAKVGLREPFFCTKCNFRPEYSGRSYKGSDLYWGT